MSTSFKNFSDLNSKLGECYETRKVSTFNSALDALSAVVYAAESVASEYAGMYSQVQWMKYSQEGDPDDVTPDQQLSIPDSVISKLKSLVKKAEAIYEGISSGSETIVPAPDYVDLMEPGGSVTIRLSRNGDLNFPGNQGSGQLCPFSGSITQVTGANGYEIHVPQAGGGYVRTLNNNTVVYINYFTYRFEGVDCYCFTVGDPSQNKPYVGYATTSSSALAFAMNSDNSTYTYVRASVLNPWQFTAQSRLCDLIMDVLENMDSDIGVFKLTIGPDKPLNPTAVVCGTGLGGSIFPNVTIDNVINPDTLYHGYSDLKLAIESL